jgi:hypothetical protein
MYGHHLFDPSLSKSTYPILTPLNSVNFVNFVNFVNCADYGPYHIQINRINVLCAEARAIKKHETQQAN